MVSPQNRKEGNFWQRDQHDAFGVFGELWTSGDADS